MSGVYGLMMAYSNSQLQTYKNCPLQWRFYWDLGLRRVDDEVGDHHLRYGAAFDKGLQAYYRGQSWSEIKEAFLNAYPTQLDPSDAAKTRENGVIALASYVKRWHQEDKRWQILEVNTRKDDELASVQIDLVVRDKEQGGIWLVDHKTTGSYLNYRYWERFQPNTQITYYLDTARSVYGEIEGFIINAISFRYRERAYKGEPAGFWCNFERQVFNRNESQLAYERLSRADWIYDLERSRENGFFRTNTDACYRCQFKSICAPGWTWEDDAELINIQYRQACAVKFANGYCELDRGHEGDHAPSLPVAAPFEVEVEV